jgi:ABC-type antimicrobial peptide transport system permease subunit
MIIHSLKQILRSLKRHKSFTGINLMGLSIGIAAVLLLFMLSRYEKGFDRLHKEDGVYRVVRKDRQAGVDQYSGAVPYPTAKFLRSEIPGLKVTQTHLAEDINMRIGSEAPFEEENVLFADSLFFSVLDFGRIGNFWIRGDHHALSAPGKAIVTESAAQRYFGKKDPVGQVIRLDNKVDVEVVGLVRDVISKSHLPFNMIVSYSSLTPDFNGIGFDQWGVVGNGYAYVKVDAAASRKKVETALRSIVQRSGENDRDRRISMYLQEIHAIHFDTTFESTNPSYTVSSRYLTMLLLLGGFIIMIACVNYINLSTSFAFTKSKEVGILKTIGASRKQLFFHYMLETVVVTTAATIAGFILAWLLLPTLNSMLQKSIPATMLLEWPFIAGAIAGIILISFISGIYPALILSGFNPVFSLKNQLAMPGRSSVLLRKALVVFQFTTSIALIICTMVISRQMDYFQKKELGFNKEAVVEVGLPAPDSTRIEKLRSLLSTTPGVENFSFCLGAPISDNGFNTSLAAPELPESVDYNVSIIPCDKAYLNTYGMKLLAGRWFLEGEEKNRGTAIVVNETMVKALGYRDPAEAIGKKIRIGVNDFNPVIIGVTKDFHTSSLHQDIGPVGMMPFNFFYYAAGIRLAPGQVKTSLAGIEKAWKQVYPESVYDLKFVDETLAERYEQERRDYDLFKAFSLISIFICCIGLWGLIAFVVVRKTKEIGIRKVLGASVQGIVLLLSKDFIRLILVALLVASPLAWYFMQKWLQDFAYRVDLSWWVFVLAGIFALFIAVATVSFQAIKAAVQNPVKNLRTE